jgi:glycosyltransferase involved in cell wall biosynthesis
MFVKRPLSKREDFVLSVGRIERRKNTLKLIEACHALNFDLTLIGGLDDTDEYGKECHQKIQDYGFAHISNIDQKDLIPYYYKAKAHAIVSWYETPGLSTMEAACGGCNIVSTDRGSTKEYFGGMVEYCDPFFKNSIEHALSSAMGKQNNLRLREKIMTNYTWDRAAEDTLKGYNKIS